MRSKLREALVAVIAELRPSWDLDGVRKALDHQDLASVNENHAVIAAIRAATDGNVRSPGVIPKPGPHWDERPANHVPLLPKFTPPRPLTDAEIEAAAIAAKAARAALAQRTSFCRHCNTTMTSDQVAGHDCGHTEETA
jgi:hypothetical protein